MELVKQDISVSSVDWSCRSQAERLYPETEWEQSFMFAKALKVAQPFLQKLIDMNAVLTISMGEWTLFGDKSIVMFHVYEDFINLECISTPVEDRGKGSATLVMRAIIEAAKETNTEIRLRACNVTGHGWNHMPNHLAVAQGMKKAGKIPTAKLQKWYEKFGFVKVADVISRGKKAGVNMLFKPQ